MEKYDHILLKTLPVALDKFLSWMRVFDPDSVSLLCIQESGLVLKFNHNVHGFLWQLDTKVHVALVSCSCPPAYLKST